MESEEKIIKPSQIVLLDDDRLEELRKKNSSLHYALQKNQTYHLASNHKNLEKNKSSDWFVYIVFILIIAYNI